jgi:hypothetical protein
MVEARISEVRVRVRTDVADAAEIRPAAERMVRAVLDRCAALLEERAPGRVVLIRRLPLRWRLDESTLEDDSSVEQLALAAADAIERISHPSVLEPPADAEGAIIFDDEPHFRASHLLAAARGRPAWFHTALEGISTAPLADLAAPECRATAHATLLRLAQEGVLAEVLGAQAPSTVSAFAAALGFHADAAEQEAQAPSAIDYAPERSRLASTAAAWPALPAPALALALRVHAALYLEEPLDASRPAAVAAAVLRGLRASVPEGPAPIEFTAAVSAEIAPSVAEKALAAPEPLSEDPAESVSTACAGLFYLLDRVQELDLAESLWKACLPEGGVLAAAVSALLGSRFAADPAPARFGGITGVPVCPPVSPEQHAEIAVATCAALAAALPRRGLATIPRALVTIANHPAGRLLAAATVNSPFVFFAWPAGDPPTLEAGLHALLGAWPHEAILVASPALAMLDKTGRLRPDPHRRPPHLFLPPAASSSAAGVLALVAGAPSLLFEARAGEVPVETAEAFVTRFLTRAGQLETTSTEMRIVLAADDVDLAVRRAGLDRDPGWVPWLHRSVRFVYQERQ